MNKAIVIKNLVKRYDDNFALGEINLEIPSGIIIGLIGENGAGKTTLIKSILGILHYKKGEIAMNVAKEDIGIVLDNSFFPEVLWVADIDKIMQGVYKNWNSKLFYDYLKDFNIPINSTIKKLSTGMKKKLEIATALAHQPKLLILDEPTSGLDPVVRNEILDIFLKFIEDEEHTILFSTHITSDLEHVADQIIFINDGKILLDMNRDEILDNYGIVKCSNKDFERLETHDYIAYRKNKYNVEVLVNNKKNISKKYKDLVIDKITLEDLMILMIKGVKA